MDVKRPIQHTTEPSVTGTSIIGIKFDKGVIIAGDTLGSYGSLAKLRSLQRLRKVGDHCLIGGAGDYSDFQYIVEQLDELTLEDKQAGDGKEIQPREIHQFLGRIMYNRRSKVDPLWNQILVAGVGTTETDVYLGQVDLYGSLYLDNTLATGYGAYIAQPLLRKAYRPDLTQEEARKVIIDCMRVLYYRDARSINKIQVGVVTAQGVEISDPFEVDTYWEFQQFINPHMSLKA